MWNSRIAGSRLFRSSRLDEAIFWIRKHCIVPLDNGLHILLYFPPFPYVDRFQPERYYEQNTQDSNTSEYRAFLVYVHISLCNGSR